MSRKHNECYNIRAIDPLSENGEKQTDFEIDMSAIKKLLETRHPRFFRAQLIREVIEKPTAIFRGWERSGQEDSLVYVGIPTCDRRSQGIELPPIPGMVFVVYVTDCVKISEWRWERADSNDRTLPEGVDTNRYGRRVWP